MSTFDHVLTFADETAAHAALDPLGFGTNEGWDGSRVIAPVRLYIPGTNDADGNVITPDTVLSGFHVGIATTARVPGLEALSGCRAVIDRDALSYAYVAPDVDPTTLANVCVSPIFAGSDYPGGKLP